MSRDVGSETSAEGARTRGWPRALALFGLLMVSSVVARPDVLVAVPFLMLGLFMGLRRPAVFVLAALAIVTVAGGATRDGLWYLERGWAVLVGGWFAALTLREPRTPFTKRALGALLGAAALSGLLFMMRVGAWGSVDWAVRERLMAGVRSAIDAIALVRGQALPQTLVTMFYESVEAQITLFPALLGIATLAALGVAWWVYVRLAAGDDQALGSLRDFRFNDHLVWLLIGGLLLMLARGGEALPRVGANAVVFMGSLYAVRGAAVILFLSGGLSMFGYALLALGLVFVPPLVLAGAMVIGIGDTWLDVRGKIESMAT